MWWWMIFFSVADVGGCLRSCCCRRVFPFVGSLVGDVDIFRIQGILGRDVVHAFIWYFIMVAFISWISFDYQFRVVTWYSYLIWSHEACYLFRGDGLDHDVMFMFLIPWLELWHWSCFSFLVLSTLIICLILHDSAMLQWSFAWNDWLQVLVDTWRLRWG